MASFSWSDFINSLLYHPAHPLIFQSVTFFLLFGVFYLLYSVGFRSRSWRNILMLAFSLYFYYKISGLFVIVLILMASSDYLIGLWIYNAKKQSFKSLALIVSLVFNIGSLIYFKYTNFILESWTGIMHPNSDPLVLNIVQPLGISYFVFKSLTYTIDLHREMMDEPEKNWFRYLLYVSFFPNILAGPISKARDLLPQFKADVIIDRIKLSKGFFLIALGLIKKIVIADFIAANLVDRIFESPQYFTGLDTLMASYGALVQLFFDFAGYTDIVVGIALLMGITVEHNFNKPFLAENISGFWRRWHITLYNWLNEYLYQPIAFKWRKWGKIGALLAVFITFFVSGIWHGAALTYVAWGLLHGTAIAWDVISANIRAKVKKIVPAFIYKFISILITFHFLVFTGVLLKSQNLEKANYFWNRILNEVDFSLFSKWIDIYLLPFAAMIVGLFLQYLPTRFYDWLLSVFRSIHWTLKALVLALLFIALYQVYSTDAQPFIYIVF